MRRFSLSPNLIIKSPKSAIDSTLNPKKLPGIKDRKSINPAKKTEMIHDEHTNEKRSAKIKNRVINFFDIPVPVDQRKLEIVKTALERRKLISPVNNKLEESSGVSRTDLLECKYELDLQTRFLNDKKLGKRFQDAAERMKTISQSIEFGRMEVPSDRVSMKKSESADVISAFNKAEVSEDYVIKVSDTDEVVVIHEFNSLDSECKSNEIHSRLRSVNFQEEPKSSPEGLSKQNSELQFLLSEANAEISNLKQENLQISFNLHKSTQELVEYKLHIESQMQLLHDEISLKTQDCDTLKDQLKKSESNRKKFTELAKDLELDLILIKKKHDYTTKDFEELQKTCQSLEEENREKKEKLLIVDDLKREIELLKYELGIIKDKSEELKIEREVAKESLDVVRKNFDNSRLAWRDKEMNYEKMIDNLLDQVQSEKVKTSMQAAEIAKLRKATILKDSDSFVNLGKNDTQRHQMKIAQLDKENGEALSEIEKLKKNIEYYTFLVRNKQEVIQKLIAENEEYERKMNVTGLEFSQDNLEVIKRFLRNWMTCQKCLIGVCMSVIDPCKHLVCSKCEPEGNMCTVCSQSAEKIRLYTEFSKIRDISHLFKELTLN